MKIEFIKNLYKSFFTVNIGNALNFFTSVLIIKSITIEEYGLFISFFSILFFFSLPNLILTQLILKTQDNIKNNYQVFKIVNLFIILICFIQFILIFILSDFIKNFFKLNQLQYLEIYLIFTIGLSLYYNFFSTLFLKTRLYMTYNIATQFMFLLKFIIVFWLYLNNDANYEILIQAHILSQFVSLFAVVYALFFFSIHKHILKDKLKKFKDFSIYKLNKDLLSIFISQFLLYAILNYDILICRSFCDDYNSGLYGAATTVSKIVYFLAASISTILLREILYVNEKKNYTKLLILLSFPLLIIYNLLYFLFAIDLIDIFLDEKYNSKLFIKISTIMNIGMSTLLLSSFLIIFFISIKKSFFFTKQIIITFATFVITYFYNDQNPINISVIFLISSFFIFGSLIYDFNKNS